MASFDQFISSIRQEYGEQGAGKKFEVFCKWFLEKDPEWSKKVDKVWLWDAYPTNLFFTCFSRRIHVVDLSQW